MDAFLKFVLLFSIIPNVLLKPIRIENDELNEAVHKKKIKFDADFNSAEHVPRPQRQIVQPEWLNDLESGSQDAKVHVNPKNLKEAAAIRKSINTAVEKGQYAVRTVEDSPPEPGASNESVTNKFKLFDGFPAFRNFDFKKFAQIDFKKFPTLSNMKFELPADWQQNVGANFKGSWSKFWKSPKEFKNWWK